MATPIDNLEYELLDDDGGGIVYEKIQGMLAKLKQLVVLYNAQIQDEGSIGALIADLQLYLDNYEGVASVNGQSGVVTLTAANVGALPVAATAENSLRLGAVPFANFYHTANKPTKNDIGLGNVANDNSFAHLMNSASATITRTAKITNIMYWDAANVTYSITSAGFAVGDKILITRSYDTTGTIMLVMDSGTITLGKKNTAAASQTLGKTGTICLERISTSTFLARAA
jgi:hypothetical protein